MKSYLFYFATTGGVEQFALHEFHAVVEMVVREEEEEKPSTKTVVLDNLRYEALIPPSSQGTPHTSGELQFADLLDFLRLHSPLPLPHSSTTTVNGEEQKQQLEEKGCRRSNSTVAHGNDLHFPVVILHGLQSDEVAERICKRCCLLKAVYKVFASGSSSISTDVARVNSEKGDAAPVQDELVVDELVKRSVSATAGGGSSWHDIAPYRDNPAVSFRYDVESFAKKISQQDKVAIIKRFEAVNHKGQVDLKNPKAHFVILLFHEKATRNLAHALHCVELAVSNRTIYLEKYNLKTRPYIGTTSMPPELCFAMCNLAKIQAGDLVYDPFCGTGSTTVSATHFGAQCLGTDMDGRALRAGTPRDIKTKAEQQQLYKAAGNLDTTVAKSGVKSVVSPASSSSREEATATDQQAKREEYRTSEGAPTMWTNFAVYQLASSTERIRMNFSVWSRMWRPLVKKRKLIEEKKKKQQQSKSSESDNKVGVEGDEDDAGFLDAIICDPPYGVREQKRKVDGEKIGKGDDDLMKGGSSTIAGSSDAVEYSTPEMLLDLILFAGESLSVGGRLVYWHPTDRWYTDGEIPSHPHVKIICSIEQLLTLKTTRWLVVMEKTSACPPGSVCRDACRPTQDAANLRAATHQQQEEDPARKGKGENKDYAAYRNKIETSRAATAKYKEETGARGTRVKRTKAEQKAETMKNKVNNQVFIQRRAKLTSVKNKVEAPTVVASTFERASFWCFEEVCGLRNVPNMRDGSGFSGSKYRGDAVDWSQCLAEANKS